MAAQPDVLVWIDCEMTGLDLELDELVEVAVVVTNYDLKPLDAGFNIVIKPDQSALDHMGDFVRQMHTESGLFDEIPNGVTLAEAEYEVLDYILKFVPDASPAPLTGNTLRTDRSFLPTLILPPHPDGVLKPGALLAYRTGREGEADVNAEMERDHQKSDPLTTPQRRVDALANICRLALNRGELGESHGVQPHRQPVLQWLPI